jgi:hypothetical protein
MEMRVDEGLRDQIFAGVDLVRREPVEIFPDRGQSPAGDAEVEKAIRAPAQSGAADQDVIALWAVCHGRGFRSFDPGSGTTPRL